VLLEQNVKDLFGLPGLEMLYFVHLAINMYQL